jgi:hypothetical protein
MMMGKVFCSCSLITTDGIGDNFVCSVFGKSSIFLIIDDGVELRTNELCLFGIDLNVFKSGTIEFDDCCILEISDEEEMLSETSEDCLF